MDEIRNHDGNQKREQDDNKNSIYHNLWHEAKVVSRRKFISSNAQLEERG